MCQFHQIKIIVRHLTRKPKSPAVQAALSLTLTETTQAAFEAALKRWYEQYTIFLNERSVNEETGHSHYTHKRLRAAYNSLKRHLPWLFTCERFPNLGIPNTTNLGVWLMFLILHTEHNRILRKCGKFDLDAV